MRCRLHKENNSPRHAIAWPAASTTPNACASSSSRSAPRRDRDRESIADQLRSIARDYIEEAYQIESVLPMNNQKCRRLVIQIQVLTQQAPSGARPRIACRVVHIICVVTKRLDVTDDGPFNRKHSFERSARADSTVVVDCQHTLPHMERSRGVTARPKMIPGNRHRAHESIQTTAIFLSAGGEAERAICQVIPETKAPDRRVGEIFNTHLHFACICQKPINRLRPLFR